MNTTIDRQRYELQARLAQVLASPKRLEILDTLRDHSEMTAGDLAETCDLSMPNLSQHLSLMKQHGLVESQKRGLHMHYRVASTAGLVATAALGDAVRERLENQTQLLAAVSGR